jgi:LCP family protein required for cell wall assembly
MPYAVRLIGLLGLLAFLAGGAAAYVGYFEPVVAVMHEGTGQVVSRPAPSDPQLSPSPDTGSGRRRMNILLLGSDTDAKFGGVYGTQVMMVVSIDQRRKDVTMLSIPRDLWVQIPGHGMGKIGTAYHEGGLALARQTVEDNFGIPIDYYAWVGLEGFIKVVDTLGGVDVDVTHPIVDDRYPDDINSADPYAYRRLYIPAGPQHLDGMRALEYVRSRHGDLQGDFGRSARQQQVLQAVRSKLRGRAVIANLPQLAADLRDSIRTDLTLTDLARLALLADQLRDKPVQRYVLSPPVYSRDGWSRDGQQIVIPDWPAINALVTSVILA